MTIFKINPEIREKIVLALDVDSIESAKELIYELKDYVGVFKVGLQFYTSNGDELFRLMESMNLDYFLDVKLMDIPNTVAKASENVIRKGASFFNLHALGGKEMMQKSMEAAAKTALELGRQKPTVLAVTILTSISDETLQQQLEISHNVNDYALKLAKLAKDSGLTGVVASVFEAKGIKNACGKDFKVLCPGIRPAWSAKDDQQRLATPELAIKEGADYLVIGRAVTNAPNRLEAMQKIYLEIEAAMQKDTFKLEYLSPARLLLDNGMVFEGESFGAEGTAFGELVFNTSMAGYQEVLSDPSCAEQVLLMTYPEIGNCGVNEYDSESRNPWAKGLIVKNYCENESHYKTVQTLGDYLKDNGLIGISGVDTRAITKIVREHGSMNCAITTSEITDELKSDLKNYSMPKDITLKTSLKCIRRVVGSGKIFGLLDLGVKSSIVSYFENLGYNLMVFPADADVQEILASNPCGLLVSSGPGDPKDATWALESLRLLSGKLPMFGIGLGHQLLALTAGAETVKMKYGHRAANHPVIEIETGKVLLTTQNHGYTVDESSMPAGMKLTHKNLNDGTVEGFVHEGLKMQAVQFYPETTEQFDNFDTIFTKWMKELEYAKK